MRGERENVSTTAGKTKATILCTRPAVPGLVIVRAVTVGAGVMVASLVMMPVPRSRPGTRPKAGDCKTDPPLHTTIFFPHLCFFLERGVLLLLRLRPMAF